jgi:hypothetical protein
MALMCSSVVHRDAGVTGDSVKAIDHVVWGMSWPAALSSRGPVLTVDFLDVES